MFTVFTDMDINDFKHVVMLGSIEMFWILRVCKFRQSVDSRTARVNRLVEGFLSVGV